MFITNNSTRNVYCSDYIFNSFTSFKVTATIIVTVTIPVLLILSTASAIAVVVVVYLTLHHVQSESSGHKVQTDWSPDTNSLHCEGNDDNKLDETFKCYNI